MGSLAPPTNASVDAADSRDSTVARKADFMASASGFQEAGEEAPENGMSKEGVREKAW